MTQTVSFADLTHTGVAIDANNNPLAVGYIAAYAREHLGHDIAPHLFKYPEALSRFLARETPRIACFTNYMWNERLSCAFARAIKQHAPRTVVVMGGPNYPIDASEQRQYLDAHPEIDFFADGEGEVAFVNLFQALSDVDFDARRLRAHGLAVPGIHYLSGEQFVRGSTLPRILDLDRVLPSPYTSGLLDEFFDDRLTPMVQTSRGCPYSCTFCHDGIAHMNKTRAFSAERVDAELAYIEARARTATLQLADLNWGMFPGDLRTAHRLAESRRRTGWPRNVMVATAKNQKERIVEMSRVLGDALQVGASVQSTDPEVLRLIKRSNVSLDAVVKMATRASDSGTGSFTEIILGLPGDTRAKHVKTVCDMLDAGIEDLRLFQFILLPGTEANDAASRRRHEYRTGFRVLARCFGQYEIYGHQVPAAEIQEVCLGTNTLSHDDYVECRAFDLTISIFNNAGVLREFFRTAEALGIRRSTLLLRIFGVARAASGAIAGIYEELRTSEARNFFESRAALEAFLAQPDTMAAYLRGEYGVNHIYKARTAALVRLIPQIVRIARDALAAELADRGVSDPVLDLYLDELAQLSVARKSDLTAVDRTFELALHFDFPALQRASYRVDPRRAHVPGGLRLRVRHTDAQATDLRKYFAQYGTSLDGLGQFLQRNDSHLNSLLYRGVEYGQPNAGLDLTVHAPIHLVDHAIQLDVDLDRPLLAEGAEPMDEAGETHGIHPMKLVRRLGPIVFVVALGAGAGRPGVPLQVTPGSATRPVVREMTLRGSPRTRGLRRRPDTESLYRSDLRHVSRSN
jgi:radical SAM superfamily enzyme YgiQ (UPF0313 family)